jgi:metal-responsive CopG/Arc/MetJ family transcriptional regulator
MKVKTSVTLSEELVQEIDAYTDRFKNRSNFLETAARYYIRQLRRAEQDARDVEIIDQWADDLNDEVSDALDYQVAL